MWWYWQGILEVRIEMSKFEKIVQKVLSGSSDRNIEFNDLCNLLETLGFNNRIKAVIIFTLKKA